MAREARIELASAAQAQFPPKPAPLAPPLGEDMGWSLFLEAGVLSHAPKREAGMTNIALQKPIRALFHSPFAAQGVRAMRITVEALA